MKKKKRLLAMLTAASLLFSLIPTSLTAFAEGEADPEQEPEETGYGVCIIDEEFSADKLSIKCGNGTAEFDGKNTLTLTNATIDIPESGYFGIFSDIGNINIVLSGDNYIIGKNEYGSGVHVSGFEDGTSPGVPKLTISGKGTLNINTPMAAIEDGQAMGSMDIVIKDEADVKIDSPAGIFTFGYIAVENSKLSIDNVESQHCAFSSITNSEVSINSKNSYPLWNELTINSGIFKLNVTSKDNYAIEADFDDNNKCMASLVINGGTLDVTSIKGGSNLPEENIKLGENVRYIKGTSLSESGNIVIAEHEHTFGEWETVVAPTCTQKGSESRKCSVCGEEETREIDALGHKFEDSWTVTKEATCTQAGSEERICTVCGGNEEGGKETREIKAKGHKFGKEWTLVRKASAGKPSLRVRYCENCKGEEEGGMQEVEGSTILERERVFGDNRFKTSLAIADQFKNANNGKAFENIIVASGADFADALSASYLAKVKNAPILLVANKATVVINETIEYIKKNAAAGANVYLVGGSSVVPNSMITDLKKLGFKAKRLAGSNRYDTNIEVLKEAGVTNEKILIASGMDYADALSASAVGLPILLVAGKGKSLTPNQKAYLQSLKDVKVEKGAAPLSKAYIIGGTGAVSAGILKQAKEIFAAAYRVAGSNRYETSVKVAETFFKKETPKTVAVAYGMNYPDGLCGGPLAIAYKCPLILTVNQKPDAAVAYAKSIKAASVVAFGGKQLISVETMNKILGK